MGRLRGIECNAPDKLAEAFYRREMVFVMMNRAQLKNQPD